MTAPAVEAPTEAGARAGRRTPYQGLVPYTEDDAEWFFGRERWCNVVRDNLRAHRITVLYGTSGVGKSSILRAGPLRRLTDEARGNAEAGAPRLLPVVFSAWSLDDPVTAMEDAIAAAAAGIAPGLDAEPTDGPLVDVLAAWPPRVGGPLLLVLDQFEEFFLYHDRAGDSSLDDLATALRRRNPAVHFLLSIREDSLAKLDRFKGHVPGLLDHLLRVDHLDRDAAEQTIVRPLERWSETGEKVAAEGALVTAVLDQVTAGRLSLADPAAGKAAPSDGGSEGIVAPYLQLVLERIWDEERRRWDTQPAGEPRLLRVKALDDLGGAEQIVRSHLDAALAALPRRDQDVAGKVFRELVTPSGAKIALRVSDLAKKTDLPEERIDPVVEQLAGDVRILRSAGERRYEIFHDALAGPVLDWSARWQERQRRRRERRRLALLGVVVLIALAFAGLALWASHERSVAIGERQRAESRELAIEARGLLGGRLDDAMLGALTARDRAGTVEAQGALLTALQHTSGLVRFRRFEQPVQSLASGPGGLTAVALADGTVAILDASGRYLGDAGTHGQKALSVAFDPRRPRLAVGRGDRTVQMLQRGPRGFTPTAGWPQDVQAKQATITSVAFSEDGRWLAAGGDGGVTLWRLDAAGRPQAVPLGGSPAKVGALAFARGQPLLAATSDQGLLVWNLAEPGAAPRRLGWAAKGPIASGPDGGAVAAGTGALLWHGVPGARPQPLEAGGGRPTALAFDATGKLLALGEANGSVALWDVARGRPVGPPLRGQGGKIVSLAFVPGGAVLAVAADDHTVALWDTRIRAQIGADLDLGADRLTAAAFGQKGTLAVLTTKGALKVGHLDPAHPLRATANEVKPSGVQQIATSPDGGRIAVATDAAVTAAALTPGLTLPPPLQPLTMASEVSVADDGEVAATDQLQTQIVHRWNAKRKALAPLEPPDAPAGASPFAQTWSDAISADGHRVAAGYYSGAVVLWKPTGDSAPAGVRVDDGKRHDPVNDLAFSPDGSILAAGDGGGTIALWHVDSPGPPELLLGHAGEVTSLAFAPGGDLLASGDDHGSVRLWDPRSGQPLGEPLALTKPVRSVAFSPKGRWLAVVHGPRGALTVWDTTLWKPDRATLDQVRRRFCATIRSKAASSPGSPCRRGA